MTGIVQMEGSSLEMILAVIYDLMLGRIQGGFWGSSSPLFEENSSFC
jgi:hypothetical protein